MLDQASFAEVPDISVDYAVMEKASRVAVVPAKFDWSDIGSRQALSELEPADDSGNRISGEREIAVYTDESTCIPAGTAHRLSNPGDVDCVMIKAQGGDDLGEDDIVRLEDRYGRAGL